MALESFYGGKQGLSSIIKAAFKYVSTNDKNFQYLTSEEQAKAIKNNEVMESCLSNANYDTVWYGELCLIDTDNKNNPYNGFLYRRTLANQGSDDPIKIYSADTEEVGTSINKLSAEYIGQIVGSQSGVPLVSVTSLDKVNEKARTTPTSDGSDKFLVDTAYPYGNPGAESINHNIQLPAGTSTTKYNAISEGIFVPGKDQDEIYYSWVNVRDNTKGKDSETWMYLGFSIPYLQIDYNWEHVDFDKTPYANETAGKKFYQNWHIAVPRGVRGNDTYKISLTTLAKGGNQIFQSLDSLTKDGTTSNWKLAAGPYVNETFIRSKIEGDQSSLTGAVADIPFYVLDYRIYNNSQSTDASSKTVNGHNIKVFLALKRDIKNFQLNADGTIQAFYSDFSQETINPLNKVRWIESIQVNGATAASKPGYLIVNYNTGEKYEADLELPKSAAYNDATGKITFTTTKGNSYDLTNFKFEHWKDVQLVGDATANNPMGTRAIQYNTNLDSTYKTLGSPINYIQDMVVGEDLHLYVLFNDPTHRKVGTVVRTDKVKNDDDVVIITKLTDNTGAIWTNDIELSKGGKLPSSVYWRDYGPIVANDRAEPIFKNWKLNSDNKITYDLNGQTQTATISISAGDSATTIQTKIANWLNSVYANGLNETNAGPDDQNIDPRGWVVAIERPEGVGTTTDYYAFNYSSGDDNGWYFLKTNSNTAQTDVYVEGWSFQLPLATEGVTFKNDWVTSSSDHWYFDAPWTINKYADIVGNNITYTDRVID